MPLLQVTSKLVVSRTRVAPLRTVTIPRLELAAAELLGTLLSEVKDSMEWESVKYTLWTDSLVTLHWMRKLPCDLKPFVGNRVSSVQTNTDINCWKYVSTKENPADLLSRGLKPGDLVGNSLWMHGPRWLCMPKEQWPTADIGKDFPKEIETEMKVHVVMAFKSGLSVFNEKTGKEIRFIKKVKDRARMRKSKRRKIDTYAPTAEEKASALEYMLRKAQQESCAKDYAALQSDKELPEKSKIEALKPIMDRNGLIRVGGRLDAAEIDYEMRHPAIIPNGFRLAWLMIDYAHRKTKHGATQVMMQYVRQKYWIPKLRSEIRSYLHKCVVCVRYNHRYEQQLMSDLPGDRVQVGKPFLHTGVDYAGPFEIRVIDREGMVEKRKHWVAIFVYLKTRAIHIDAVGGLTSVAFLACYDRFISRRGRCERMYSDNGTTFVGAAKELRRAIESWRTKEVFDHLNVRGTEWHFMVPAAPHQGGIYEAAVKSMKHHLVRVIGMKVMVYEQFITLLTEIEGILNSRPLHPLSDDPTDIQALTPGHFLVGEPIILPPPYAIEKQPGTHGVRLWRDRQKILDHFWKRWSEEYLATLQERKKWRRDKEPVKTGQLVLLKSENFPPSQWAIARVIEVIESRDGRIRSVVVKTAIGKLTRPVQKICILPVEVTDQEI